MELVVVDGGYQWRQVGQVGGQVDVHVGHHVGSALGPGPTERPAPTALFQSNEPDARKFFGEGGCDFQGGVGGAVVGDDDVPVTMSQLG